MVSDAIGDFVIQLKNAQMAGRLSLLIPFSNLKWAVAEELKKAGYLRAINKKGKKIKKYLEIELIYENNQPRIHEVKRISKPSRRIYHHYSDIHAVRQGFGLALYSTPRGVLTDKAARAAKVGGEILFKIW